MVSCKRALKRLGELELITINARRNYKGPGFEETWTD